MLSALQPFGEPDCESDLDILGEDKYSQYYLDSICFNRNLLDPSVYLISGRRGSGKTSLTKFFSFQTILKGSINVDVDEPAAFHEVISKIIDSSLLSKDLQIPQLVKIWEYVIWSAIFCQLKDEDIRIHAACKISGSGSISNIIRLLFQSVLNKYIDADGSLTDELDDLLRSKVFAEAQKAVLDISAKRPVLISIDTLEKYSIHDERLMIALAALVEFASKFCRGYALKGLHIKVFLMDEMFPYLTEEYISNTLKYVKNEVYLHWKPKDLMRLICWRLFQYLKVNDLTSMRTQDIDWISHRDVKEKVWKPHFGEELENSKAILEETFPYILRHTHLRPRQLIVVCNAIADHAMRYGSFPDFSSRDIAQGVAIAGESLAQEVFNAYSAVYPNAARIADALSGIEPVFEAKELDKRAHQTASQWQNDYSPYRFRQFVAELGIIGRVRQNGTESNIVEADFEHFKKGRLILSDNDICVVHPMFYTKLNVTLNREICVYPFPDHQDYMMLNRNSYRLAQSMNSPFYLPKRERRTASLAKAR